MLKKRKEAFFQSVYSRGVKLICPSNEGLVNRLDWTHRPSPPPSMLDSLHTVLIHAAPGSVLHVVPPGWFRTVTDDAHSRQGLREKGAPYAAKITEQLERVPHAAYILGSARKAGPHKGQLRSPT